MANVPIGRSIKLPVPTKKYVRNTQSPSAAFQNIIAERTGYAAHVRAKPVFVGSAYPSSVPTSDASERSRWRFAAHAGPYTQYLYVQFTMARQDTGTASDPYVMALVTDRNGVSLGIIERHYGASSLAPSNVPSEWGTSTGSLEIPADEDYFVEFIDASYGRLVAAAAWEGSFTPDTSEGWSPVGTGSGGPILDVHRSDVVTMARALHKKNSAQLWNWHVDTDAGARVTTSASYKNPVDDTSTTPSSATPGVKFNLAQHTTMSRVTGGCRVAFKCFGSSSNGTGNVRLVDDAGATVLTCAITNPTAGWHTTFGYVPASDGEKYDLHYGGTTGTLTLYATSLYEYDQLGEALTGSFATTLADCALVTAGVCATPPEFVLAGTAVTTSTGSGTVAPAWPTHAIGDVALLHITMGSATGGTTTSSLASAAGFTLIDEDVYNFDGINWIHAVWGCRATSTSQTAPSVQNAAGASSLIAVITTYRGCAPTGAYSDASANDNATTSTSVTIPGLTLVTANSLIVDSFGFSRDANSTTEVSGWTNASLTSITERFDQSHNGGPGGGIGVASGVANVIAGASVGATTATLGTTGFQARVKVALKPPT
jgi:hypothetical protein